MVEVYVVLFSASILLVSGGTIAFVFMLANVIPRYYSGWVIGGFSAGLAVGIGLFVVAWTQMMQSCARIRAREDEEEM